MGLEGITKFMQSIFYLIFYTLEGIVYSFIPHKLLTRRRLSSDIVLITGAGYVFIYQYLLSRECLSPISNPIV